MSDSRRRYVRGWMETFARCGGVCLGAPRVPASRTRGFTLIELLVVIAIISLLVAILIPSLNRAKELARRVVCASDLHQAHLALITYAQDNKGHYPMGPGTPNGPVVSPPDRTDTGAFKVQMYPKYIANPDILYCPSDDVQYPEQSRTDFGYWGSYENTAWTYLNGEYCQIGYQYTPHLGLRPGQSAEPDILEDLQGQVIPQRAEQGSSESAIMADTTKYHAGWIGSWYAPDGWIVTHLSGDPQGGNVVYNDAHAEWTNSQHQLKRLQWLSGGIPVEVWW